MELNKKLKELRLAKGWTQKDLAEKLNLVSASISGYERDISPVTPSIDMLTKIATEFGITLNDLIDRPDIGDNQGVHEGNALKRYIDAKQLGETDLAKAAKMNRSDFYYYYEKKHIPLNAWEKLKAVDITREEVVDFYLLITQEPKIKNNHTIVEKQGVPVYNVDFTAGDVSQFADEKNLIIGYVNFDGFKNCTGFVRVTGQSMEPEFRSGDWIGLEPQLDLKILEYGNVFGIVTKSGQRLLKIIRKGATDDILLLRSFNPDYDDITIDRSDLLSVCKAHGPIRNRWQ